MTDATTQPAIEEMTDDEFLSMPEPSAPVDEEDPPEPEEIQEEGGTEAEAEEASEEPQEAQEGADEVESVDETTDPYETQSEAVEQEESSEEDPGTGDLNYQSEYEKLLEPFKAAKREVRVSNVDEARRLMQKGVDYSRKMAEMKPQRQIIKTLERNGLLNPEKINFVIDMVSNKNPEAIKKFLKDNDIDPYELPDEDNADYKPTDRIVSAKEMELETVLEEIEQTEQFDRTSSEIQNKWDTASKQVLADNPGVLRLINDHVGVGIYDQIMNIVEQERLFGRLEGLSDLEAYKAIGDAINDKGGFEPYQNQRTSAGNTSQGSGQDSGSREASNKADQLRNRKRAAGPTKGAVSKSKPASKNFLQDYTDEEIEKMGPAIL